MKKRTTYILLLAMLSVFGCAKVETYVKDVLKEDVPIDFSWYSNRNIDT